MKTLFILASVVLVFFLAAPSKVQGQPTVLKPNQLVTFSLAPGQEKVFVLQMKKGELANIESLAPEEVHPSLDFYDATRKELLNDSRPYINSAWFTAQTDGDFLFVIGLAKDEYTHISGAQRITVQYSKHFKLPIGTNLRLNSITVPTSLAVLVGKLGRDYFTYDDIISGNYYIWKFQNGLEISVVSGSEDDEPFYGITFSTESQKPIPNCPFGFVLNQTTFDQVKSRFGNKLRKLPFTHRDGFKVYSTGRWNHFYFKNKKLVEITIAQWEMDKVS